MVPTSRILVVLAAATLVVIATDNLASAQELKWLGSIAESQVGEVLPEGWTVRGVRGQRVPATSVEWVDGAPALTMRADSAAGQAWLELEPTIEPSGVELLWEWRVNNHPGGAALQQVDRDDSPARFFVVFGGGGLFGRPRVLFYSWGDDEARGAAFISHVSDRVGVIVVRNSSDELGAWVEERRDLAADFRRVFGRDPDDVRAIGLMSDTDQLGGVSETHLRSIRIIRGPPPTWEERRSRANGGARVPGVR